MQNKDMLHQEVKELEIISTYPGTVLTIDAVSNKLKNISIVDI